MAERPRIEPRGMSRVEAATYLGIGTEAFDRGVDSRLLPQPRRLFSKRIWDRRDLDRALDELPHWTAEDRRRGGDAEAVDDAGFADVASEREAWNARN